MKPQVFITVPLRRLGAGALPKPVTSAQRKARKADRQQRRAGR